jgi:NADPH-dependent glutamate synthase beta subunit-like oxidoreductase
MVATLDELPHPPEAVRQSAGAGLAAARALMHPREALERSRAVDLLVRDELIAAPRSSLNLPIGATRRLATVHVGLEEDAAGPFGAWRQGQRCRAGRPRLTSRRSAAARNEASRPESARGRREAQGRTLEAVTAEPRRFQRSERRPAPGSAGVSGPSSDITPLPDLLHGRSRSGPVREERPVYVDLLPPCNNACPAGENIQAWLAHVNAGEYEQAWRCLVADNPFAAIHGRVCYHPCETDCNRRNLDSAVSIHAVERFLGDTALERGWLFDPPALDSGKRVLVIGGGPSGLSAAYHLARLGHEVEIRDAGPEPGGMMRYGIPAYRMPRDVLSGEVDRIAALGVKLTSNHRVTDLELERREGGFDAVFVAVGAHLSKRVNIPARDAGPIVDAVSFLRDVASGEPPVIGRRVAVYGGGNTAMDAARVARRLGAEETLIVYRRTREQMPAHEEEAQDAEKEGVRINWLRTITALEGAQMQVEVMELDESGFPQPTGRFETLAADTVILALGQDTDTGFLRPVPGVEFERDGTVRVSPSLMTGAAGVFAGGDMVPAERTVTVGVGHGKRAAREIDAWLRGEEYGTSPKHPLATFNMLNLWYFGDAAQRRQPELEPAERVGGFDEVVGGLSVAEADYEASRCLSCGNCCECDGCLGACPEDAVIKLGPGLRYRFDYDRCTGCRACFEQCPVHSIEMFPEPG